MPKHSAPAPNRIDELGSVLERKASKLRRQSALQPGLTARRKSDLPTRRPVLGTQMLQRVLGKALVGPILLIAWQQIGRDVLEEAGRDLMLLQAFRNARRAARIMHGLFGHVWSVQVQNGTFAMAPPLCHAAPAGQRHSLISTCVSSLKATPSSSRSLR